jgi:hypothetical protein
LENPRRMKRDSGKIRGFIPGTVNLADLSPLLCRFLVYFGGIFNCINKFNEPKMPYLLTLALTKFLLEFITQPIRSGSRSELSVCPKYRIFILHTRSIIPSKEKVDINSKQRKLYFCEFVTWFRRSDASSQLFAGLLIQSVRAFGSPRWTYLLMIC